MKNSELISSLKRLTGYVRHIGYFLEIIVYVQAVTEEIESSVQALTQKYSVDVRALKENSLDSRTISAALGAHLRGLDPVLFLCYVDTPEVFSKVYALGLTPILRNRGLSQTLNFIERIEDESWASKNEVGLAVGAKYLARLLNEEQTGDAWCLLTAGGGSSYEIGRSAYLYRTNELTILIDCGIKVTPEVLYPHLDLAEFDVTRIDLFVMTHSHADHSAMCPALYAAGYAGPILLTEPTRTLAVAAHLDYFKISSGELNYSPEAVALWLKYSVTVPFDHWLRLSNAVRLMLKPAGHILGSAMIVMEQNDKTLLHTADFNFPVTNLLKSPEVVRADVAVTEGTYLGVSKSPASFKSIVEKLETIIAKTKKVGGHLLIPVLAIGRGQQMLLLLRQALRKEPYPLYVDGCIPQVTKIYEHYGSFLSEKGALDFSELPFTTLNSKNRHQSWASPCIILTTSGMCEAGPIIDHLKNLVGRETTRILMSTACITPTAKRLSQGASYIELRTTEGVHEFKVAAEIVTLSGLSGHATHERLTEYINKCTNRMVIITHCNKLRAYRALSMRVFSAARVRVFANCETLKLW